MVASESRYRFASYLDEKAFSSLGRHFFNAEEYSTVEATGDPTTKAPWRSARSLRGPAHPLDGGAVAPSDARPSDFLASSMWYIVGDVVVYCIRWLYTDTPRHVIWFERREGRWSYCSGRVRNGQKNTPSRHILSPLPPSPPLPLSPEHYRSGRGGHFDSSH